MNLIDAIGRTPLIRLNKLSEACGSEILGKAEFMNPGGSVKDRAALGMILAAEANGDLKPGATIVEGTAGNTGIGLAMVGNARGYRTLIVMPNTQSPEKVTTLEAYGAEVLQIPAVPYKNPEHFVHRSKRIAEERNAKNPGSAFWPNQFENTANREFHEQTTGREIIAATDGAIDGFICAVGTGGTLAGVSRALRAHNPDVCIGLADPEGSALHEWFSNRELKIVGSSISEGIGNSRITANLADTNVDYSTQISDAESLPLVYQCIRDEGLVLGSSSAVNLAGAVKLAKKLGRGKRIVTILCDSGLRYSNRLFNKEFLIGKGHDADALFGMMRRSD